MYLWSENFCVLQGSCKMCLVALSCLSACPPARS